MLNEERDRLRQTREAIRENPGGFNQARIELPPEGGPPCGCTASYLVAVDDQARKLFDDRFKTPKAIPTHQGDKNLRDPQGNVLLAASYAIGRTGVPRLFNADWPADWYSTAGRDRPTGSSQQPTADDAVAVLDAVTNDKLPEALVCGEPVLLSAGHLP